MNKGPLIILSGPSGSGKSTVIDRLLAAGDLPLRLSVSATTRPPRDYERDGVHYHFWTAERFKEAVPYASALVVVPNEPHSAGHLTTGRFDWRTAPKGWQLALRRLAVAITAEWAKLGVTARTGTAPVDST